MLVRPTHLRLRQTPSTTLRRPLGKSLGNLTRASDPGGGLKRLWNGTQTMRQVGIQRNGQGQAEALVRLLLEPVGRRQRQKLIALLEI
jgi:hypothetical protein